MKIVFKSLFRLIQDQIEAGQIRGREAQTILLTQAELDELLAELPDLRWPSYGNPKWVPGAAPWASDLKTYDFPLKDGTRYRLPVKMQLLGVDVCVVPSEIVGKLK